MSKLLGYFLKKRVLVMATITLASIAMYLALNYDNTFYEYDGSPQRTVLAYFSVIAAILATLIPIFEYSYKMKKVSVDQVYSLPLKRYKYSLIKTLVGLIELIIPLTISYIFAVIFIACHKNGYIFGYFFLYYPVMLICGISIFGLVAFMFNRANSIVDGLFNVAASMALSYIVIVAVMYFVTPYLDMSNQVSIVNKLASFQIYAPIDFFTSMIENKLANSSYYFVGSLVISIITTVIGVVLLVLNVFLAKYDKAENCLQKSESWISYRTLIPVLVVSLAIISSRWHLSYFIALIVPISYFAYVVYRRSFKLSTKYWIVYAIVSCSAIILGVITYFMYK